MTGVDEWFSAPTAATGASANAAQIASDTAITQNMGTGTSAYSAMTAADQAASKVPTVQNEGPNLGKILGLAGTAMSSLSSLNAGKSAVAGANYNAGVARLNANNAAAAGEANMALSDRQTQLALSRNRAVSAAGGGSATDPSVVSNAGQIAGQGAYNSLMDLYNGESRSQSYLNQGNLDLFEGQQAQKASVIRAGTTAFTGVGQSLYSRYGAGSNMNVGY